MACCLMAPSHYMNQCWLGIISLHPHAVSQKMYKICRQKLSFEINIFQDVYASARWQWVNSLAPGRFQWNFTWIIVQLILVTDGLSISFEIVLLWMSLYLIDDKSTLVQVMAWCRQATSHYLSQCWPRSLPPYGVTRPQWVNALCSSMMCFDFCDVKSCSCCNFEQFFVWLLILIEY